MADEWYCKISGEESGPLSVQDIKTMAAEGQLLPEDLVRRGSSGAWVPAGRVKGLFPDAGSASPPAAPAASSVSSSDAQPKALPKARPVAKPISGSRPPPVARPRGGSPPPPPSPAEDEETAPTGRSDPPVPPKPKAAGAPGEFDFLEDAYTAPATSPSPASAPVAADAMEKKRQQQRRTQTILFAVMGSLVLVLLGLMLFLLIRGPHKPAAPESAKAADGKAGEAGETKKGDEKKGEEKKADAEQKPAEGAKKSKDSEKTGAKKEPEPVWIDASKRSALAGDITVKIVSAELRSPGAGAPPRLHVKLELANGNKQGKIVEYTSWNTAPAGVRLVDDVPNPPYALGKLSASAQPAESKGSIYPKEKTEEELVFKRPVSTAKYLRLTLPASAFGEKGSVYFEIPMSMVTREPSEPDDGKSSQSAPSKPAGFAGGAPVAVDPAPPPPAKPRRDDDDEKPTGKPDEDFGISTKSFKREKPGPGDIIQEPEPEEKAKPGDRDK